MTKVTMWVTMLGVHCHLQKLGCGKSPTSILFALCSHPLYIVTFVTSAFNSSRFSNLMGDDVLATSSPASSPSPGG